MFVKVLPCLWANKLACQSSLVAENARPLGQKGPSVTHSNGRSLLSETEFPQDSWQGHVTAAPLVSCVAGEEPTRLQGPCQQAFPTFALEGDSTFFTGTAAPSVLHPDREH